MPQQTLFSFCGVKPPEAAEEPEGGWLVIDLFCSIGGVSAAAKALGHRVVLAIDAEQWRLDIHELNHPECTHVCMKLGPKSEKKLDKLIRRHVPEGDRHRLWIHASPPCQTNSKLQSMEYWNSVEKRREKKGVGLRLLRWACDFIVKTKPAQWSLEEVDDFNQRVNGELRRMKRQDPSMVDFQVFNFADFGLPQTRKRVIGGRPATIHALRHAPGFRPAKRTSIGEVMASVGTMPENAYWYHGGHQTPKHAYALEMRVASNSNRDPDRPQPRLPQEGEDAPLPQDAGQVDRQDGALLRAERRRPAVHDAHDQLARRKLRLHPAALGPRDAGLLRLRRRLRVAREDLARAHAHRCGERGASPVCQVPV